MKEIQKYISIILLFLAPIGLFYSIKTIWLLTDGRYKQNIPGNEIYCAIEKSKIKTSFKKLILGDSTGNQFYNCKEEDSYNAFSLTCNQAIGMIGQYILLNNYLKAGNSPDSVFIVLTPFSLMDNLDQIYTYHYFLKPFYYEENKPYMTTLALEQIEKIPFYWGCHVPFIQTSTWAPNIHLQERNYTFISPLCKQYLSKIDSLSHAYDFDYSIVPSFVAEHLRDSVEHFNKNEYLGYRFAHKLSAYIDSIHYLNDTCFVDEVHLKSPDIYRDSMNNRFHIRSFNN